MIKGQNRLVKIAQHGVHADPAPLRLAGQTPQNPMRGRRAGCPAPMRLGWAMVAVDRSLAQSHRQIGLYRGFGFYPFRERVSSRPVD